MENTLMIQVKAAEEFQHPFNQDVRQESPPFYAANVDYKLNILDLNPNSFWQMLEFIYKIR